MADDDQRAAAAFEFAFQPFDGREIEMVGRLVQQQDIGRGRQHPRQRRAAGFAAGDMRGVFIAVQPELLQQDSAPDNGRRRGRGRPRHRPASSVRAEIRLLRQIADGGARLHEAAAAVGLDEPGGDLQAASICRSRCGRSGRRARPTTPIIRRRTTAACRRRSARCLSTGSAEAPSFQFNSGSAQAGQPAGAGCGGWSGRAPTETPSGRAAQTILARRSPRPTNADRSSNCAPRVSCRSIVR